VELLLHLQLPVVRLRGPKTVVWKACSVEAAAAGRRSLGSHFPPLEHAQMLKTGCFH